MRKGAHAGKNPADAPSLNHRLVDVGAGVPPLANPHDAPELRKDEQVLWVITEREEFTRGGDTAQLSDSLFRSAHLPSLSNRGALDGERLLSVDAIAAVEVVKEAPDTVHSRPLLGCWPTHVSRGTHDRQDDVLQNGNLPLAQEIPRIHEGAGTVISLTSQRRQVRESIFPAKRRLGRVLQDCDLINVNVRAEHLFFGYSVLQDILLQNILLQVGPPVIAHRTGNGRERVGEPG